MHKAARRFLYWRYIRIEMLRERHQLLFNARQTANLFSYFV